MVDARRRFSLSTLILSSAVLACAPAVPGCGTTSNDGEETPGDTDAVSIEISPFAVPPNTEVYKCQNFPNPFKGAKAAVSKIESSMAEGSHHLLAFTTATSAPRPLEDCSGLEFDHPLLYASQTSEDAFTFPEGVGAMLQGTQGIRVQAHYINASSEYKPIKAKLTFHRIAEEKVKERAGILFVSNSDINVPPHATADATFTCKTKIPLNFIMVFSHMHQQGTNFQASVGGKPLYTTREWSHPQPRVYDPPLGALSGDELKFTCTYQNPTSTALTFGQSVTNEMCVMIAHVYPFPENYLGTSLGLCQ